MKIKQQKLLLDPSGKITSSVGDLFPDEAVLYHSGIQLFPFIEGMFTYLYKNCVEETAPIYFQKVSGNHALLPGYYDYHFSSQQKHLLWKIIDQTERYQQLWYRLQEFNEWEIKK